MIHDFLRTWGDTVYYLFLSAFLASVIMFAIGLVASLSNPGAANDRAFIASCHQAGLAIFEDDTGKKFCVPPARAPATRIRVVYQ
jgi:hypothetical protein